MSVKPPKSVFSERELEARKPVHITCGWGGESAPFRDLPLGIRIATVLSITLSAVSTSIVIGSFFF